MATRVFDEIKFCEHVLNNTSQGTFLPSLVQIGQAIWEKMFKEIVDDAQRTQHHPKGSVGPNYGVDRTMGLNPKVRTNFGVENFQPHSSVGYPMLCTIGPNYGVEP